MALTIGVSHPSIWRWAQGKNSPSLLSIESMANALGYKLTLVPLDTSVKDV
jgi:transcriptional regulator with XRE-family HTH domain